MPENTAKHSKGMGSRNALRCWQRLAWFAAAVHGLASLALSLTRFHTGKVSILDIGLFDQALWNTLRHGSPSVSAVFPDQLHNLLGVHFSAIVFTMLPIYRVFPLPELLLGLQSLLIAGTGIVVFRICMKLEQSPRAAFLWTLAYLLNPFVVNAAVWDFHEKSFALPAMTLAFLALIEKRRALFLFALLALLLCREHYGLAVAGFGGLWLRMHGMDRMGTVVTGTGLASVVLVLFFLMPALRPVDHEATPLDYQGRYSWVNRPLPEAAEVAGSLAPSGLSYIFTLLLSTGGAALMAPSFLLPAIADLAANLLSANPMPRSLLSYHSMALVPIFLISAVRGCGESSLRRVFLGVALCASSLLTYWTFPLPLPGSSNIWQIESLELQRPSVVGEINKILGPNMSLSAQSNVGGYFSHRLQIYRFPDRLDETDAVVLNLKFPYDPVSYTPFGNPYPFEELPQVLADMERVVHGREFGLTVWEDDWLLAIRGAEDRIDREEPARRLDALRRSYEEAAPDLGRVGTRGHTGELRAGVSDASREIVRR